MKIGLSHTGNAQKHQYYIDWLRSGSGEVEITVLAAELDNAAQIEKCDGLVLSGGIDIYPGFYGNNNVAYPYAPVQYREDRDKFEIKLYELAQENNLPVLGICRGLQLINVIHRGTLIQNLGDEWLNPIHKGEPDKSHPVNIEKDSLLYQIVGETKSRINSAHHQSVDQLGEGLMINARSEEGIVEGIERKEKNGRPFLLAIQWHPERMFRFSLEDYPTSKAVRERFLTEIKSK